MQINLEEFLRLRHQLPVVDVRSEGEFQEGHIRSAINIPLLNNVERIAVGTDYKQKGQAEAIKTGFRLVGPRLHDIVIHAQQTNNEIIVHCWRGGMRSSNFCQFVGMAGVKTHQLKGGYKVYRQHAVESFSKPFRFLVLGGCTGSGKTEILRALSRKGEQVIDLEGLAHHKGSAFGGLMMPTQPTTEQFQNELFEEITKLDFNKRIWIEDESIAIGKIFLPHELWQTMKSSAVVEMKVTKPVRVERLVKEYGDSNKEEFLQAMMNVTQKLGGQHFNTAKEKWLVNDMHSAIDILLTYYDKAYLRALEKKKDRIKLESEWDGISTDDFVTELIRKANALQ
ncbi:MAG TPA: tRNA 2-selenouridine(34) synthase MnmH [Chryseolinea sp.]|nr:tRNA 2-selenouridine(34) synthase MnmH [Chryseolinea sp.]HPM29632.1 tRNA 2-selenouridine(34) synthase MnmH [Chryseolinea sp.]